MPNCCLAKSTVHKNWNNSKRGRKWQLKIGQNMQKPSSNLNVCFKIRHNEAHVYNIKPNIAHFRTKFNKRFNQKKLVANQNLGDGY